MEKFNYELVENLQKLEHLGVVANKGVRYSPLFLIYGLCKVLLCKEINLIFLSDALLSFFIPILKILKGKPIIIKVHGLDVIFPNTIYQFFMRRFISMADKIICISEATKKECIKRNINSGKCKVIPVGIDANELFLQVDKIGLRKNIYKELKINLDNKKILFSVGRLVERKGFHWFIENVIPGLLKERKDFVYLIAGEGRYKDKLKNIIQRDHLENYVILLGQIDDKILKLLYNLSDIFIMPNIPVKGDMEGFGIVVLEAASCGLAIVASDLEGIKDALLEGNVGIAISPLDPYEFSKQILKLLEDDALRESIGIKARHLVIDNFAWNKVINTYLDTFKEILK